MNVQLHIKVPVDPVVSGTPLPVRTVVRNIGANPIELPPPGMLSPLTFVVRDLASRVIAGGNAQGELTSRLGIHAPTMAPKVLPPGSEIAYDEDVSSYFGRSLPAGRYELVVELRQVESVIASASASFVVESLAPDAVVRTACGGGVSLGTLVAHRYPDGRKILLYTYADKSRRWRSTLRPVLDIPAASDVPTLALVPRSLTDSSFAWAAVLNGESLHGVLVRPFDTAYSFGPIPLAIGPARMIETGVPLPDGGALLLAIGQDGNTLLVIHVDNVGKAEFHRLRVPPGLSKSVSVAVAAERGGDRVHLCWIEGEKSAFELSFPAAEPDKGPNLRTVYQTPGRILAIQADPPASGSAAFLHVLEELPSPTSSAIFKRITLDQNVATETTPLTSPPFSINNARHWLLPSSEPAATGPVLVTADGKTWLLENGAWRTVEAKLADSGNAKLIRYNRALWLSTWLPRKSLELQPLK